MGGAQLRFPFIPASPQKVRVNPADASASSHFLCQRLLSNAILAPMSLRRSVGLLLLFLIWTVALLNARVVRVEITSRNDVLNGKQFGDVGAYERIVGRVYFSVPVGNPHNRSIV